MAENTVRYYNYESYDDAGSDETTGTGDVMRDGTERKTEIQMRKNEARSGSVMMIIFVSLLAAALLGSVIYSLDKRNTMYNRVADKNHELSLVEADNVRLQSELESKVSAKNVEDYAKNVLSMQKIDSSQIKYIKTQESDEVKIPEKEKGIKAKVKSFFEDLVEYFRG